MFQFFSFSARDKHSGEIIPRTGTFIDFQQKSVVVQKWDDIKEGLFSFLVKVNYS